jgi:hypothetical protein
MNMILAPSPLSYTTAYAPSSPYMPNPAGYSAVPYMQQPQAIPTLQGLSAKNNSASTPAKQAQQPDRSNAYWIGGTALASAVGILALYLSNRKDNTDGATPSSNTENKTPATNGGGSTGSNPKSSGSSPSYHYTGSSHDAPPLPKRRSAPKKKGFKLPNLFKWLQKENNSTSSTTRNVNNRTAGEDWLPSDDRKARNDPRTKIKTIITKHDGTVVEKTKEKGNPIIGILNKFDDIRLHFKDKKTIAHNASIRKKAARRLEKSNVAQAAANAIKKLS